MTNEECRALRVGAVVRIFWFNSRSRNGTGSREAIVRAVHKDGLAAGVSPMRSGPGPGGRYWKTVQWIPCKEILEVIHPWKEEP